MCDMQNGFLDNLRLVIQKMYSNTLLARTDLFVI